MSIETMITVAEFEALAGGLHSCELVRGEVVKLSPGGIAHSRLVIKLGSLLEAWATTAGSGWIAGGEIGLIVQRSPDTVRGADLVYYSNQRLPLESAPNGFSSVPPNLVVEIIGKGQGWGDTLQKVGEYLRMGVNAVWVVDPNTCTVHIYKPDLAPAASGSGEVLRDAANLPGFECKVADLFID